MEVSIVFPADKDRADTRETASIHPFSTFNSSTHRSRELYAAVAMGANGAIGLNGDMPWHLPEDLRHFKELTMGHPVIMGRATWLSIPRRPLPGRRNIVLSRSDSFEAPGAEVFQSLTAAIDACPPAEIPFIIGGGSVYREALPLLTRIYVTRIDASPQADTFFPDITSADWDLIECSDWMTSRTGLKYRFEIYESRNNQ